MLTHSAGASRGSSGSVSRLRNGVSTTIISDPRVPRAAPAAGRDAVNAIVRMTAARA